MNGLWNAIGILVVVLVISPQIFCHSAPGGFSDPTNDQFHIQTDEGPERYFRYQTHSGQYRKEKRLEDGTVVGSYGWIDSTGLLRLQDYIADNAGYRILRTKDIYVGRNRPISQAIKVAKKVPGNIIPSSVGYVPPVSSTTPSPLPFSPSPTSPTFVSTTYGQGPKVDLSHNSYPDLGLNYGTSTIAPPVSSTILPPLIGGIPCASCITSTPLPPTVTSLGTPLSTFTPTSTPGTVVISPKIPYGQFISSSIAPSTVNSILEHSYPSSTPSPVYITTHRPSYPNIFLSTTPSPIPSSSPNIFYDVPYTPSTIAPPINSNSLDYYDSSENPYIHRNGPTYPLDRHGNPYFGRRPINRQPPNPLPTIGGTSVPIGNGYDPQYPKYDGISVTNDGFRYYIPRAYHEEQGDAYNNKAGSFGYIDPFGIRRVVYYNAGAGGFQHRKNNRYVGFNATPYDPRPYKKKK